MPRAGLIAPGRWKRWYLLEATDGGTRTHVLQILRGLDRREFRLSLIASAV